METVWRFRIVLFVAFAVLVFSDVLDFGNVKSDAAGATSRTPGLIRDSQPQLNIDEEASFNEIQSDVLEETQKNSKMKVSKKLQKTQLTEEMREACLPKMLCEMASRPTYSLNDKERGLLDLIKSTTLSLALHMAPTRWHFATHMGQLLRYSGDALSGPIGCSHLWPQCPLSSQKLTKLSNRVVLK